MDSSSSGRSLTSFGAATSEPTTLEPGDTSHWDDDDAARFTPTALDIAYRAFVARDHLKVSIPPVFCHATAVDSASFAGQGATFAVYRRRIPPQNQVKSVVDMGSYVVKMDDTRKLPSVVAYKVAMIEFSDKGEALPSSRYAINAAVMELYLSTHRPILQHPNLVEFLGLAWGANPFDSAQKLPILVMEFAEYGSLSDLQRQEYLPMDLRRRLCLDVCQGLDMLHSCGVVHGDVKAENILIFPDEAHKYRAKLSDFGYSVVMNTKQDRLSLGGTRPWKAPEAKAAVQVSDAKYTDVYSLALLIWCTAAHGHNIFKLLVGPSKQGEEFYAEAERLKESGELSALTDLSAWYLKAPASFAPANPLQLLPQLQSFCQRLQDNGGQLSDPVASMDEVEAILCALPPVFSQTLGPMKQQLVATIQQAGIYGAVQRAVTIGLSKEPSQRDLRQIMVSLGHNGTFAEQSADSDQVLKSNLSEHRFSWHHWTMMDPSVQKYLTTIYVQRSEEDVKEGKINPPEAFLLAALYINGYGVDRDTSKAATWLLRAWRNGHPLAKAYGYRIVRALDITWTNPESVIGSLNLMALHGSRTALKDLAAVSQSAYEETRNSIRNSLAGTGADFFFESNMLHGFNHGMWIKTLGNIPVLLENFSRLNRIADYKANKRGDRILHLAASCGQTEAIEALLDRFDPLDVNQLNDQGETPLLCACRAGQTGTVLWLASRGALASVAAQNGESPLHWLISFDDGEVESVGRALIQAGADVAARTINIIVYQSKFPASLISDRLPPGYPIGWGTHCGRPQIVKFLLSNMINPMICVTSWPRANSALEIAASQHRSECLDLMLHTMEQYNTEQGSAPYSGFSISSLLQQAVVGTSLFDMILYHGPEYQQAMESTFRCLLPRTSKVAFHNHGGFNESLLYSAVSRARDEVVEYLVEQGVDVMKTAADYDEEIMKSQNVGAFKIADINRPCGVDLRTPLLEAVRWNRPKLVHLLLKHGAQATAVSKNPFSGQDSTWTALHILAQAGQNDPRLIQTLLEHGAPLDGFPDHSRTTESPLLLTVQNDAFQLADALVSHGANINFTTLGSGHLTLTNPATILGHVIASNARNSIARTRYLLDGASTRDRLHFIVEPTRQWTALHRAAAGHLDAAFRGTDATEATPLEFGDVDWDASRDILNELLRRFHSSEQIDAAEQSMGFTALHLAVQAGNEAAVSLLLDHGARADVPSWGEHGVTAAAMAHRIQREGLSKIEEGSVRYGRKEVMARNKCANLLNPPTPSTTMPVRTNMTGGQGNTLENEISLILD